MTYRYHHSSENYSQSVMVFNFKTKKTHGICVRKMLRAEMAGLDLRGLGVFQTSLDVILCQTSLL